ncbi:MAG TPA: DUF6522 family protein [Acetobacteraceae bacterium]|jgi:hypothetical protein
MTIGDADALPEMTVDANVVAPLLDLEPSAFIAAVRRGAVLQRTERGIEQDAGLYRITFRYRRRRCRIVMDPATGRIAPA